MTGIAVIVALLAVTVLAAFVHASRRRRRGTAPRPFVLATPGGRAFAANVGSLSDFRVGLELPRRR